MTLNLFNTLRETSPMPVLFVGHGNPMNAIEENEFTNVWQTVSKNIPEPSAILCISAHWETRGTFVTAMEKPKTIHDFGGFPPKLYDVQYNAPGSPELATHVKSVAKTENIGFDYQWGLDHGCWSVIKHFYPLADAPIVQLSIDYSKPLAYHIELAKELAVLRNKGVLIIGSGNIVHNLGIIDWHNPNGGYDWAIEANEGFKKIILDEDSLKLTRLSTLPKPYQLSVPTPEHYIPLLYALGTKKENENISFFNDKVIMGSLAMTSLIIR